MKAVERGLEFGSGRLIAATEGLNVRNSLDSTRIRIKKGKVDFNATAACLVAIRPYHGKGYRYQIIFLKGRKESASEFCRAFI